MSFAELPLLDGFQHWDGNTFSGKWTTCQFSGNFTAGGGREGGIAFGKANNSNQLLKTFVNSYTQLFSGVAFKNNTASGNIIQFQNAHATDGGANNGQILVSLNVLSDYRLQVSWTTPRKNGLTTGTYPTLNSTWFYFEFWCQIGYSGGGDAVSFSFKVKVNNVLVINEGVTFSNGTDGFQITAGNKFNNLILNSNGWVISDFYAAGQFYGDIVVSTKYPTGAGNYTQWTPTGAASNWQCVDEHPPDGDTTYNTDSVVGNKDSFTMGPAIPTNVTVLAVQYACYSRKDASGTGTFQSLYRSSGVDQNGQTFSPSDVTYAYFIEASEVSPFSGIAWTPTEVNALEAGYNRNA